MVEITSSDLDRSRLAAGARRLAARAGLGGLVALAGAGVWADEAAWRAATAMPTARSELAATALGGRVYVAGGIAAFGASRAFEVYNPDGDTWEKRARLPTALHHLGLAALGAHVYASGGYTGIRFTPRVRAVWAYDPRRDSWAEVGQMPAPRAAHAMVGLGDRLYFLGGVGPGAEEVWSFAPATGTWRRDHAPLPTPREHLTAVALSGKLYAIGDRGHGHGNRRLVEVYDPLTDRWSPVADMHSAKSGFAAGVLNGRLHVAGGEALDSGTTFSQHEMFDPATGTWTVLAALPSARHGVASASVEGGWFVIGGATRAGAMTLFTLTDRVEVFSVQADP